MTRWLSFLAMALAAASAGAQTVPPSTPLAYAVLGLDGATLGARSRIVGHVGAENGMLVLRAGAHVAGTAAGQHVVLRGATRVDQVFCVLVQGGKNPCQPLPSPLLTAESVPVVRVTPGREDVTLPRHAQRVPLEAGRWRDLTVAAAGDLMLVGGTYSFRNVKIGARSHVTCMAPCALSVRGGVMLGRRSQLELQGGMLSIQGAGAADEALVAAPFTMLHAQVYTPRGAVRLGEATRLTGVAVGRTVTLGPRVRVTWAGTS